MPWTWKRWTWRAVVMAAVIQLGCGYRVAQPGADPTGPYALEGRLEASDPAAFAAAKSAARQRLAEIGELADANRADGVVVVALSRVQASADGISADPLTPLSHVDAIEITGRAWLETAGSSAPMRTTGDVTVRTFADATDEPLAATVRRDALVQRAARELGRTLIDRLFRAP